MFKHVIWDFDGTLFDTYPCMTYALDEALKMRGIKAPMEEIYSQLKRTTGIAIQFFTEKYALDENLARDFLRIRIAAEADMCLPYPGIRELLEDIIAAGGFNYVSTNRGQTLFTILDRQNMTGLFRDFATAEDKLPLKPDPALNLKLIETNDIPLNEAVIVGDRELDVVSGQRAGIKGLAYSDGSGTPIPCADLTATNVDELRALLLG